MSKRSRNLSAGPRRSWTSTPTNTTPRFFQLSEDCASVFASSVQGGQYDCQKLITATFLRSEVRLMLPEVSTRGRVNSGAGTMWPLSACAAVAPASLCASFQTSSPSSAQTSPTDAICATRLMRRAAASDDEHRRADGDVLEQPLGLRDEHADAAVRGAVADASGIGRPVDADAGRRQAHPARAEWVAGAGRDRARTRGPG